MVAPNTSNPSSLKSVEEAGDELLEGLARLSDGKRKAIESLIVGTTVAGAAEKAGVHRGTVSRWILQDADFNAALNALRMETLRIGHQRLMSLIPVALMTIENAINRGDVRAAMQLLKHTLLARLTAAPIAPELVAQEMHVAELQQQTALHQQQAELEAQREEAIQRASKVAHDRDARIYREERDRALAAEVAEEERLAAEKKRQNADARARQQVQKQATSEPKQNPAPPAQFLPSQPGSAALPAMSPAPVAPAPKHPGQATGDDDWVTAAAQSAADSLGKLSKHAMPRNSEDKN